MVVYTYSCHQSKTRREEDATSQAGQEALREHELPVLGRQAHQEHARHFQRRTDQERRHKVPGIEETARDKADDHGQPDLQGSNPGDCRRRDIRHHFLVVCLEAAERVEVSPRHANREPR